MFACCCQKEEEPEFFRCDETYFYDPFNTADKGWWIGLFTNDDGIVTKVPLEEYPPTGAFKHAYVAAGQLRVYTNEQSDLAGGCWRCMDHTVVGVYDPATGQYIISEDGVWIQASVRAKLVTNWRFTGDFFRPYTSWGINIYAYHYDRNWLGFGTGCVGLQVLIDDAHFVGWNAQLYTGGMYQTLTIPYTNDWTELKVRAQWLDKYHRRDTFWIGGNEVYSYDWSIPTYQGSLNLVNLVPYSIEFGFGGNGGNFQLDDYEYITSFGV